MQTAVIKGIGMMIATNTAKCVNCNDNHTVFSRDCPTWKKEKATLRVKYEKSQKRETFLRSNWQLQAKVMPASLKVPVYTFHAQTQTDETCIATSNAGSIPTPAPNLCLLNKVGLSAMF